MLRADRLPAVRDGIAQTAHASTACGAVPAAVRAQESLALGIKPGQRLRAGKIGKVVAPFAVFGFVIDHPVFHFHFAGVEVALEIGGVILGIPQAELHQLRTTESCAASARWLVRSAARSPGFTQRDKIADLGRIPLQAGTRSRV